MRAFPARTLSRFLLAACLATACSYATQALAAEMRVGAADATIAPGDAFEASVSLDTQGGDINAVQGTLTYPPDLLEPVAVQDADSAIDFWVIKPKPATGGTIEFSGIAPGGFKSDTAHLFSVEFRARKDGQAQIGLRDAEALYGDGKGTAAPLSLHALAITVSSARPVTAPPSPQAAALTATLAQAQPPDDMVPPEPFTPTLSRSKDLYGNRWFLVFATQDKQSGVDHYEVRETPQNMLPGYAPWHRAESPYLIKDQSLSDRIGVKAVDRDGNVRIATVTTSALKPWYEGPLTWLGLGSLLASVLLWGSVPRLSRKRR